MIANCLSCCKPYNTNPKAPPHEYPYCIKCNLKQTLSLEELMRKIDPTDRKYLSRPGKRHGQKTRIHLESRKEEKRLKREARKGIYENSLGALNGLSLGF